MPLSPICLVSDNGGAPASTANGVNVGSGHLIAITLQYPTNVTSWYLTVYGTDELTSAPVFLNDNVDPSTGLVASPTSTVTFIYPIQPNLSSPPGQAIVLQSVVNGPLGTAQTTFGIFVVTNGRMRVGAVGQTREGSSDFGWITILNPLIRNPAAISIFNSSTPIVGNPYSSIAADDSTVTFAQGTESETGSAVLSVTNPLPSTIGTVGQVLTVSGGAPAPAWETPASSGIPAPSGATTGDILIYEGGWIRLAVGTAGEVLTVFDGSPAWRPVSTGVTVFNSSTPIGGPNPYGAIGADGTTASYTDVSGVATLSVVNPLPVGAPGDLLTYSGSAWATLGPGSTNQVLTISGGAPAWETPASSGIPAPSGATTGDILYYNGSAWTGLVIGGTSQVLTVSGGAPAWETPSASGIPAPGGAAIGDLLAYSGSAWTTLAPGTSGNVLTSTGASLPTWQAVPPAGIVNPGGATGDLLAYSSGAWTPLAPSSNSGWVLTSTGGTSLPTWQVIPTSGIPAPGGAAIGDLLVYSGSAWTAFAPGTSGNVLTSLGAGHEPEWATVPGIPYDPGGTLFTGELLVYSTSDEAWIPLGITESVGYVLTTAGGLSVPTWQPGSSGGIPNPSGAAIGDLLVYSGSAWVALGITDTAGYVLTTQGGAQEPSWQAGAASGIPKPGGTIYTGELLVYSDTAEAWVALGITDTAGYVLTTVGGTTIPTWQAPAGANSYAIVYPNALASAFTLVGTLSIQQATSNSVLLLTGIGSQDNDALLPVPGGVNVTQCYTATMSGAVTQDYSTDYPSFGVIITNGTTAGTSVGLTSCIYQYGGGPALGAWTLVLTTQSRPHVLAGNNDFQPAWPSLSGQIYSRILFDGTNYLTQWSACGGWNWRTTACTPASSLGLGTITNFGASIGCTNGFGGSGALVTGCSMVQTTSLQSAVSNAVSNGTIITITTATDHHLVTGASITITNMVYGGAFNWNTFYEGLVTVTGLTTFTMINGNSISYTSGGTVTRTDV